MASRWSEAGRREPADRPGALSALPILIAAYALAHDVPILTPLVFLV